MTLDEALEAAVAGERVTAAHMAPGWFVDYPTPFNGWYRNTPHGSRSQFIATDEDRAADWGIVVDLPKRDGWGKPVQAQWGKAGGGKTEASTNPASLPPGVYTATFDEIKMTPKGPVFINITVVRDAWGRPK